MTEQLLVSTAPVFEVDGEVKGELARDLTRLEVEETTAGLKTMTARLLAIGPRQGESSHGLNYLDGAMLDFGKPVAVSIGPASGARTIFDGFISALEVSYHEGVPPEVTVFCEDRLMDLRMTRRSRTYENTSDADIAEAIASEHGIEARVDAPGPTYKTVQQWNQSDLAFLRDRARLLQAEIWIEEGALHFQTRDKRSATEMTLVQGNHILDIQARADLAHQRTKVKVSGYDAGTREAIDEEAGEDAVNAEISGGQTGAAILERAFGERISYRVRTVPIESTEATEWAKAEMLRRARSFVTIAAVTSGTPDMVVASRVTIERVGAPFDGAGYYVTRVRHTYDSLNGHRTHFVAERATIQGGA